MKRCLTSVLCIGVLISCSSEKKNIGTTYIDTRSLFVKEIEHLSHHPLRLAKTLQFGDSIATQNLETVNWSQELQPFTELDLCKKSYRGRFSASTKDSGEPFLQLTYTSTDIKTDLQTVTLLINKKDSALISLHADFNEDNTLYKAHKNLSYYADSLFTISGSQSIHLGKAVDYKITGMITEGR